MYMHETHKFNLRVGVALKWFVSQTPYLVHETSKTPHITGCRVLLIVYSLYTYMYIYYNILRISSDILQGQSI